LLVDPRFGILVPSHTSANVVLQPRWYKAYEFLAQYGQYDEVLVVMDPDTKEQIGWTLMCSPSAIFSQSFAFRSLAPTGEKTGQIAAVGVAESARGKGVGLAMMVEALRNMRGRGVEGVIVDSASVNGFYERLGFETLVEYVKYSCDM
jgi:beta-N-acetylhexosaminidase